MTARRIDWLLWGALTALLLAPVWTLPWFPTQDGPSHVENAAILLQLVRGEHALASEFFEINRALTPNWLGHAVLAALIAVFGAAIAEKLVISLCLAGLPLAARYALRGLRPDAGPLAILAFPLAFNCLLHYGFYNFCLSLPLFFLALGMWLRGSRVAAGAALLAVLYGCHVVSWGLALLAMATFRPRAMRRLALAAAPSVALAAWFFSARLAGGGALAPVGFGARWYGLTHLTTAVFSYAGAHQWTGAALALFLTIAAAVALLRRVAHPPAVFSAAVLLLYFVAPQGAAGGSSLLERLNLFFFLSLVLLTGAAEWGTAGRTAIAGGAAAFTVLLLALNLPWYREANRQAAELLSAAPHIQAGTAWVPLLYDVRGPGTLRDLYGEPLRHLPSYIAVSRSSVNLDNYEAQTDLFPVRFRDGHNPGVRVGAIEANPPRVRLDWPLIAGVLLWDPGRKAPPLPAGFTLVFTSQRGAARVWQRR